MISFTKSVNLGKANHQAWLNKGISLTQFGKFVEASADFNTVLELERDYAPAWYHKGLVSGKLSKPGQAQRCFERAKELGFIQ